MCFCCVSVVHWIREIATDVCVPNMIYIEVTRARVLDLIRFLDSRCGENSTCFGVSLVQESPSSSVCSQCVVT